MIKQARSRSDLEPGELLVEFTGGSTGSNLAFVCAVLAHPISIVTADCVAEETIASMRPLGIDLEIVESPDGCAPEGLFDDLRAEAVHLRDETGASSADKFTNEDQLAGCEWLGRELGEQRSTSTHSIGSSPC